MGGDAVRLLRGDHRDASQGAVHPPGSRLPRIATLFSILIAFGIVLTDERGASRLSPRNFRLLQNRILLRAAPRRMWYATRRKRARYETRRKALETEAGKRPEAWRALRLLLTNLKTDLLHVRGGLERARRPMPRRTPTIWRT